MEVELKYRLTKQEYDKCLALFNSLSDCQLVDTEYQENYFYDNSNLELEKKRVNFRLRRINAKETKSVITIKGKGQNHVTLKDGVSRISEIEETIDNQVFDQMKNDPSSILNLKLDIVESLREELTAFDLSLSGLELEVDETEYDFGTAYEIEVEHADPETTRAQLEGLFNSHGITFSYSKRSKFGNLKAREII
ncbi:hypothetical protein HK103_005853 [Boothiomyces macroporosus]|uniref:CYTH domain-containing protein n=1 Tax=Boothiomyces macroporosus TaxID=261099 RepID=A0AAD5UIQ5_9FUNG|nr:hypothetical protein HK103_005853 [Boothiomyces macroporosus]